ncbi:hypothetical protein, partial [uncultured Mucilaginibacter sp.]|uniref:hypothetical protein n=1 Tax=uncultured Mucilaginibacter sp. TaxID=797541 RepID=UPI0025D8A798
MKNWTVFVKLSLVVLLAAGCTQVFAQPYPITGVVILLPSTPDQNTGNWGNMRPQFTITATANSTSRKMDPAVSQSKMLMIITKGGDKVCGAYSINSAPADKFNNWNNVWTGIYAARLLGQGCILPPGDYQLSVQFFGYQNGEIVALSEEKIKAFSISGNGKPTNQQPGEINPGINIQTRPTNPKRPIYPQQTVLNPLTQPDTKPNNIKSPPDKQPGADNAAVTTDTKPTNTNKPVDQQASGGNPAVEQEPKPANPRKPDLLDRLRKINIGGISQGTISINLGSLASCDCGNWSPITINRTLKIDCGGKNVIPWKCGEAFDFLSTYNCTSKDKSCHAVTAWQIKKDGALVVDGQGDHNITGEFIPQANGRYILTLTADCNGKKCEPCVYTIDIEDCKTCNCGTWGPLLVS